MLPESIVADLVSPAVQRQWTDHFPSARVVVTLRRQDGTRGPSAGVDDHDVEAAERSDGVGDNSRAGAGLGEVDRQSGCRADRIRSSCGAGVVAPGNGDDSPLRGERCRDGTPETARRAEHERSAAVETEIHQVPIHTVRDTV